jgi:hypothetical protein
MRDFWEFISDAGGWGVASVLAAVVSFGFGIYEHIRGSSVSAWVLASVSVVIFWLGAYKAWGKKSRELSEEKGKHEGPTVNVEFDFNVRSSKKETLRLSALNEPAFNVQVEGIKADGLTAVFEPISCLEVGKPFSVKHRLEGVGAIFGERLAMIFLKRPKPKTMEEFGAPILTTVKIFYTNSAGTTSYVTDARFEGRQQIGTVKVVAMTRSRLQPSTSPSP